MKPCPFCGAAAHHHPVPGEEKAGCTECGAVILGEGCLSRWERREKPRRTLLAVSVWEFVPAAWRESGAFCEAWAAFERRRSSIRKPLTARAVSLIARDLVEWGVDASVQALDASEKNGWLVPYRPKVAPVAAPEQKVRLLL